MPTPAADARRLAELKAKLAARTNRDGTPITGYKRNVAALKAGIARLSMPENVPAAPAADPVEPAKPVFKPKPLDTAVAEAIASDPHN